MPHTMLRWTVWILNITDFLCFESITWKVCFYVEILPSWGGWGWIPLPCIPRDFALFDWPWSWFSGRTYRSSRYWRPWLKTGAWEAVWKARRDNKMKNEFWKKLFGNKKFPHRFLSDVVEWMLQHPQSNISVEVTMFSTESFWIVRFLNLTKFHFLGRSLSNTRTY